MNPQSESASSPQMIKYKKKKESIYCKVENVKRIALLKMVKEEGKTLKEASNILGINYSTAKTILRVYRIEKRILNKYWIRPIDEKPEGFEKVENSAYW